MAPERRLKLDILRLWRDMTILGIVAFRVARESLTFAISNIASARGDDKVLGIVVYHRVVAMSCSVWNSKTYGEKYAYFKNCHILVAIPERRLTADGRIWFVHSISSIATGVRTQALLPGT